MKISTLQFLRCPKTKETLHIKNSSKYSINEEIIEDKIFNESCTYSYEIKNGIPRFVENKNYTDSFGLQWNFFQKTQLDSYSGLKITSERFWKATNWDPKKMKNKLILDAGCGSGRFAEIALKTGAQIIAIDFSRAVDACYENLKNYTNIQVIQADIYNLPFDLESFDYIYSLGVLQHTPDVKNAFLSLTKVLKKEGSICVDFYEKTFFSKFLPKYLLRPITTKLSKNKLFNILKKLTPTLLKISEIISKMPFIGRKLKYLIPVANYKDELPLNTSQLKEWALLDTFDWLSPAYDNPQSKKEVKILLKKSNIKNAEVLKAGHLVGRGKK